MYNSLSEFELIQHFFPNDAPNNNLFNCKLNLGIGDDCALFSNLKTDVNYSWAISKDLLIENTHFFSDVNPYNLGYKALAVNLSDLAAMGATPCFFLLGIALPHNNYEWIQQFTKGVTDIAKSYNCLLIGGDTTKTSANIVISITILGQVELNKSLNRANAKVGDEIWISNTIGDARLALGYKNSEWFLTPEIFNKCINKLELPIPRIELGKYLLGIANSCIDLSDGLIGDLQHILNNSNISANLYIDKLPKSHILKQQTHHIQNLCALGGGDDYELCFTAPAYNHEKILNIANKLDIALTCVGKIIQNENNLINKLYLYENNQLIHNHENLYYSFDHFINPKT